MHTPSKRKWVALHSETILASFGWMVVKRFSKTFLVLQSMHLTVNKTASSTSCIGQIYKYMLLSIVEILLQDLWRVPIQLHSLTFSCICTTLSEVKPSTNVVLEICQYYRYRLKCTLFFISTRRKPLSR